MFIPSLIFYSTIQDKILNKTRTSQAHIPFFPQHCRNHMPPREVLNSLYLPMYYLLSLKTYFHMIICNVAIMQYNLPISCNYSLRY